MIRLPRLYAIIDAGTLAVRGIALQAFARNLAKSGVTLAQYRDKLGTREQILANARVISEAFRDVDATLVMNDSAELALAAGWHAVHVGQDDVDVIEARRILGPEAIIGASTHNTEQVRLAEAAGADYIAIGPVFSTATKSDHEPVVGLEGVRNARALTSRPLVAIGGITADNAAQVICAGADSVAVIGALAAKDEAAGDSARSFLAKMPQR